MADQDEMTAKYKAQQGIAALWKSLLLAAEKSKPFERFRKGAALGKRYYMGPHDDSFKFGRHIDNAWNMDQNLQVTANKTFELVKIMGPFLYQQNPVRRVAARGGDPVTSAFGKVLECYLNYTPGELDLKRNSRRAINDTLIQGRGVLWPAYDEETGLVGSFYEDVSNIRIDPDCTDLRDAWWIARKGTAPKWYLVQAYGEIATKIKGVPDRWKTGDKSSDGDSEKAESESNVLVDYWEIYSKMGVGPRARKATEQGLEGVADDQDNVRIVIAQGCPIPLAIGTWPAPFFMDGDWPMTLLDFNDVPGEPWPMSIISAAEGETKAIDLLASFILTKAYHHSKEIIAQDSALSAAGKEAIRSGLDRLIVEIDRQGADVQRKLRDFVDVISVANPGVLDELLKAFDLMQSQFEARTGLSEMLYAMSRRQLRSAAEANIKQENSRIRPDDMADLVDEWMTKTARKEAILARFLLEPEEIQATCGPELAGQLGYFVEVVVGGRAEPFRRIREMFPSQPQLLTYYQTPEEAEQAAASVRAPFRIAGFGVQVAPVTPGRVWEDTADMSSEQIMREFAYALEAGSIRPRTPEQQLSEAERLLQTVGAAALQVGDYAAYNQLWQNYYRAGSVPAEERIYLRPPLPPEMPGPEEGKGKGGGGKSK